MSRSHVTLGILLFAGMVILLTVAYFRARKLATFRWWGWVGLATVLIAELLLFRRLPWVTAFFTPLVWTGYLLLIDAAVWHLRGQSRLGSSPREFLVLAFWSVPLWLIFEAYNLRLANWAYVGVPESLLANAGGTVWAFATIWPAIFETADFLRALVFFPETRPGRAAFRRTTRLTLFIAGLLCLTIPVVVPRDVGQYLFGLVWLGFIFALDPVNYLWKGRSLLRDFETGQTATFYSLLWSGLVCGILWEFWNYWAGAKWVYVFPIWQDLKIFEMPLPGYLGFPAFALECYVMYGFVGGLGSRLRKLGHETGRAVEQVGC